MFKKILIIFCLMVFPIVTVNAEENMERVDCFDYYELGMVEADIDVTKSFYNIGETMPLRITVRNKKDYPVVDGNVFFKVYKKKYDSEGEKLFLVDQFFTEQEINIEANGEKKITHLWKVPSGVEPGDYKIVSFVTVEKKFNLSGLSFTDDVFGNTFDFEIRGINKGVVEFNREGVTLNGEKHRFFGALRNFSKDEEIIIRAPLVNTTKENHKVKVTVKKYYWDGLDEENLTDEKVEVVNLSAGEIEEFVYKFGTIEEPVSFVVLSAQHKDSSSILNIRFAGEAKEKAKLNFLGINEFPLKKGENLEMYFCANAVKSNSFDFSTIDEVYEKDESNPGYIESLNEMTDEEWKDEMAKVSTNSDNSNSNYIVKYSLKDKEGNILSSYESETSIGGSVMGLKSDFMPTEDMGVVYLDAVVSDLSGNLVDQVSIEYDCDKIKGEACLGYLHDDKIFGFDKKTLIYIGFSVLGIIVVLILIFIIKKAMNNSNKNSGTGGPSINLAKDHDRRNVNLSIFFIFLFTFLVTPVISKASSKSLTKCNGATSDCVEYDENHTHFSFSREPYTGGVAYGFWITGDQTSINVEYKSEINKDGQVLNDNEYLCPGDEFVLEAKYGGSWNFTGYYDDTPPLHWNEGFNYVLDKDKDLNYHREVGFHPWHANGDGYMANIRLYTPFVFDIPDVEANIPSGVNCSANGKNRWNCEVNENFSGNLEIDLEYPQVQGKGYYYVENDLVNEDTGVQIGFYTEQGVLQQEVNINNDSVTYYNCNAGVFAPVGPMNLPSRSTCTGSMISVYVYERERFGHDVSPYRDSEFAIKPSAVATTLNVDLNRCDRDIDPEVNGDIDEETFVDLDEILDTSDPTGDKDMETLCWEGVFVTIQENSENWTWDCGDDPVSPTKTDTGIAYKEIVEDPISQTCQAYLIDEEEAPECGEIDGGGATLWPNPDSCNDGAVAVEYQNVNDRHTWYCETPTGARSPQCSVPAGQVGSCKAFTGDPTQCNSQCHLVNFEDEAAFNEAKNVYGLCVDGVFATPADPEAVENPDPNAAGTGLINWKCGVDDCFATVGEITPPTGCGTAQERIEQKLVDNPDLDVKEELLNADDLCNNGKTSPPVSIFESTQDNITSWKWNCD